MESALCSASNHSKKPASTTMTPIIDPALSAAPNRMGQPITDQILTSRTGPYFYNHESMRANPALLSLLTIPKQPIKNVVLDGHSLNADQLRAIANGATLELSQTSVEKMEATAAIVADATERDEPVYGINTGFGLNSNVKISADNTNELQKRILRSHATAVGELLPAHTVRRMMALRANTLAKGHSGIRPNVVQTLVDLFNTGCTPKVRNQGTVGASGDLVPLAHIGLALLGEGEILDPHVERYEDAAVVLERYSITPVALTAKEGLCLINGTQFMAAVASEALEKSINCFQSAFPISGLSLIAMLGHTTVFDPRVSQVRQHPGQALSADLMRIITPIGGSRVTDTDPQDPYSLRCIPQVYGPIAESLASILNTFKIEWNASTDNPLVFLGDGNNLISAGNFHGNILGLKCDELAMHLSQLSSIAYPRISNLLDPNKSRGLSAFLAANPGLDSGLMTFENVAAALLSEIKAQSNPASVDSIPTCAQKEDHVAMGGYAARKAVDVATNTEKMLAVELLIATHAIHQRRQQDPKFKIPPILERLYTKTAALSPVSTEDRYMERDFHEILKLIQSGSIWRMMPDLGLSNEGITITPSPTVEGEKKKPTPINRSYLIAVPLDQYGRLSAVKPRDDELRFGELVDNFPSIHDSLSDQQGLITYLNKLKKRGHSICFTLDASQDDFGARANFGRGNLRHTMGSAWDEFLSRFANVPVNPHNEAFLKRVILLGSLDLSDLHESSYQLHASNPNEQKQLTNHVSVINDRAQTIVRTLFEHHPSSQLAYFNGDHNNMTSIISGFYQATHQQPILIYLDLHADCRPNRPGPHSGNWHTQLQEQALIKKSYLVGMNPMSNSDKTVENLEQYNVSYTEYSWYSIINNGYTLKDCAHDIVHKVNKDHPNSPVILSICGDSISLLPASAGNSVIGYNAFQVYQFISTLSKLNVRALNIAELKPSLSNIGPGISGEFLTQAFFSFATD